MKIKEIKMIGKSAEKLSTLELKFLGPPKDASADNCDVVGLISNPEILNPNSVQVTYDDGKEVELHDVPAAMLFYYDFYLSDVKDDKYVKDYIVDMDPKGNIIDMHRLPQHTNVFRIIKTLTNDIVKGYQAIVNNDKIVIPVGITEVESGAFSGISADEVYFKSARCILQTQAFADCWIDDIHLPEKLPTIPAYCFRDSRVENIFLPDRGQVAYDELAFVDIKGKPQFWKNSDKVSILPELKVDSKTNLPVIPRELSGKYKNWDPEYKTAINTFLGGIGLSSKKQEIDSANKHLKNEKYAIVGEIKNIDDDIAEDIMLNPRNYFVQGESQTFPSLVYLKTHRPKSITDVVQLLNNERRIWRRLSEEEITGPRYIIALKDFKCQGVDVEAYTVYNALVDSYSCLSQDGDCWLVNASTVVEGARVYGNALISHSNLKGDVTVSGQNSSISDTSISPKDNHRVSVRDSVIIENSVIECSLTASDYSKILNSKLKEGDVIAENNAVISHTEKTDNETSVYNTI